MFQCYRHSRRIRSNKESHPHNWTIVSQLEDFDRKMPLLNGFKDAEAEVKLKNPKSQIGTSGRTNRSTKTTAREPARKSERYDPNPARKRTVGGRIRNATDTNIERALSELRSIKQKPNEEEEIHYQRLLAAYARVRFPSSQTDILAAFTNGFNEGIWYLLHRERQQDRPMYFIDLLENAKLYGHTSRAARTVARQDIPKKISVTFNCLREPAKQVITMTNSWLPNWNRA